MATLSSNENTQITITKETDSICHPCPHRVEKLCHSQEKVSALDQAHAEALGLAAIKTLTWQEAKQRIKEKMTLAQFHQTCASCEWKQYGICENVLSEFLSEEK